MKRNWDIIRDVLIEVEALDSAKFETIQYGPTSESDESEKDAHGVLLWKAGFIEGADASCMDGWGCRSGARADLAWARLTGDDTKQGCIGTHQGHRSG